MKDGRLNKEELEQVARIYATIEKLHDKIPRAGATKDESATSDILVDVRNRLGDLMRWQDFGGVWQKFVPKKEGAK